MQKILIVVIDGCSPEYFTLENAPNIYGLCEQKGFIKNIYGAVPTVTNVNHASILSGLWPNETQMVGNFFYDHITGKSGFIQEKGFMKATTILQHIKSIGGKTALLTVKGKILEVYGEDVDLGISAEKPDLNLLEQLGISMPPKIQSVESSKWILDSAYTCIQKESPEIVYCTTNDYIMHHYGPNSEQAKKQISDIDNCIKKIHELEPTRQIYITADHGMNKKTTLVNFQNLSEQAGFHVVCVPPMKDRYIENHSYQEGGTLYVYMKNADEMEKYLQFVSAQISVDKIMNNKEAAELYHLPINSIGDYVIFASEDYAFAEIEGIYLNTKDIRTHGSLYEREIPLAAINPVASQEQYQFSKDITSNILQLLSR